MNLKFQISQADICFGLTELLRTVRPSSGLIEAIHSYEHQETILNIFSSLNLG